MAGIGDHHPGAGGGSMRLPGRVLLMRVAEVID